MIVLEKINIGSNQDAFLVINNGSKVGYITKFKKEVGYNHPWKGFKLDGGLNCPNTLTGCFYGSGARDKAIKSLLK
jgi:hypothetical protein